MVHSTPAVFLHCGLLSPLLCSLKFYSVFPFYFHLFFYVISNRHKKLEKLPSITNVNYTWHTPLKFREYVLTILSLIWLRLALALSNNDQIFIHPIKITVTVSVPRPCSVTNEQMWTQSSNDESWFLWCRLLQMTNKHVMGTREKRTADIETLI